MRTPEESTAAYKPGYIAAINRHSQEIAQLRWIMLNMLRNQLPARADDEWIEQQLLKAGATDKEVETLVG